MKEHGLCSKCWHKKHAKFLDGGELKPFCSGFPGKPFVIEAEAIVCSEFESKDRNKYFEEAGQAGAKLIITEDNVKGYL